MSTTKKAMSNTETAAVQAVVQGILEEYEAFQHSQSKPQKPVSQKKDMSDPKHRKDIAANIKAQEEYHREEAERKAARKAEAEKIAKSQINIPEQSRAKGGSRRKYNKKYSKKYTKKYKYSKKYTKKQR
jgi:negative regulator of sigma E activity